MAVKPNKVVKLQLKAGEATPAPPVGTVMGPTGINIGEFVQKFNKVTEKDRGQVMTVVVNIYSNRSFDFVIKSPPVSHLIKGALSLAKGSGTPNTDKVGKLSKQQLEDIAKIKLPDLNTDDINQAMLVVAGSARSMGVEVEPF